MSPVTGTRRTALLVIRVSEPLDAMSVAAVGGLLDDAVAARPAHLLVDLAGCERLDAAGLALIIDVHRRMRRDGGRMILRGLSPQLHRVLAIT